MIDYVKPVEAGFVMRENKKIKLSRQQRVQLDGRMSKN